MKFNQAIFSALLATCYCTSAFAKATNEEPRRGLKKTKSSNMKKTKASKSCKDSSDDNHGCDVNTFAELQGAIDRDGDIKLCCGTIAFTEQIDLKNKQLTFTCPNGGCVLDAESKSRFFRIQGGSNISFDGITFKNGNVSGKSGPGGVSPQ